MKKTNNKGGWTELYTFVKLLLEQKLLLSDKNLNPTNDFFNIKKVTTQNLDLDFQLIDANFVKSIDKKSKVEKNINISDFINTKTLQNIANKIKDATGTFEMPDFEIIQNKLGFTIVKGGTSSQKADISLDIEHSAFKKEDEGFEIKSYLGSKPTLLNALGNTNFIFEIKNLDTNLILEINNISSKTKLKDRIEKIIIHDGEFNFLKAEKETMDYNLKMIDSNMPEIIGYILLAFYKNRISKLVDIINYLCEDTNILIALSINDKKMLIDKVKRLLVAILLGLFAGKKWDGTYESNGTVVVKSSGDLVAFHVVDIENMKNYLYKHIKLDTPSTTRHKYGLVIQNKNSIEFKLNLQLRF